MDVLEEDSPVEDHQANGIAERADGESEEPGSPRPIPRSPQEPVPAGVKNPLREKPSRQIGNQKS